MSPHEVLGIGPEASPDEVRAAFRRFAAQHHPDHGGDTATFVAGQEAYRKLLNDEPNVSPAAAAHEDVVFHRRRTPARVLRRALTVTSHRLARRPTPPPRVQ